jgi:tetratricopeptide (TPR) repeat protein
MEWRPGMASQRRDAMEDREWRPRTQYEPEVCVWLQDAIPYLHGVPTRMMGAQRLEGMSMEYRAWSVQRVWELYRIIFPATAGIIMFLASLMPWLIDPLGTRFSAWSLQLDLGWQMGFGIVNYGVLCMVCALYAFWIAFRAWKMPEMGAASSYNAFEVSYAYGGFAARKALTRAGLLCLVPLGLFLLQFLLIDLTSITELARHQMQAILIKSHLGYGSATTLITIDPNTFDPLSLHSRLAVIVDNLAPGIFLPLIGSMLLLASRAFWPQTLYDGVVMRRGRLLWMLGGALLLGLVLGRGPAALMSNFQAQHALSIGDYTGALSWLDTARMLNPELDRTSAYHIERGQAWYYLRPEEENEEAMLYLSSTYRQQKDYLSSYEELLIAWNRYSQQDWVKDELSASLTALAEQSNPVAGMPNMRLSEDSTALPWLQELVQVDPMNAYAHYLMGRIFYEEQNYPDAFSQMQSTLDLVQDTNFRSAAYTYMGLSSEMLGKAVQARNFFFAAVDLDPGYHNNTARQELSGMR